MAAARAREWLEPRRGEMVDLIGDLVGLESPSDDAGGLRKLGERLASLFGPLGELRRHPAGSGAAHLQVDIAGAEPERQHVLVLCHYDTVWPVGTLAERPFRVDDQGVAQGPGCFDMKGGIALLYFTLRALAENGLRPRSPVRILLTCDEEVGSLTSRPLIESCARSASLALVLESPLPGGALKTRRKGTGDYLLRIHGRAAHAGIEPRKGIDAIQELAHQTLALHRLNDDVLGTTVTVGVVKGGSRPNVVAAQAEAQIDVRVETLAEADRLDAAMRALRPVVPGSRLAVEGGLNRPPMERSDATGRLFHRARVIAEAAGIPNLSEGSTGGGSDGNFTAALGIPTLDGLGPEGDGAHAAHEQLLVGSLPQRGALIAGLLAES